MPDVFGSAPMVWVPVTAAEAGPASAAQPRTTAASGALRRRKRRLLDPRSRACPTTCLFMISWGGGGLLTDPLSLAPGVPAQLSTGCRLCCANAHAAPGVRV